MICGALEEENQRIHQFGQDEEYKGMGESDLAALADNRHLCSCRRFSYRLDCGDEYRQLTNDHRAAHEKRTKIACLVVTVAHNR